MHHHRVVGDASFLDRDDRIPDSGFAVARGNVAPVPLRSQNMQWNQYAWPGFASKGLNGRGILWQKTARRGLRSALSLQSSAFPSRSKIKKVVPASAIDEATGLGHVEAKKVFSRFLTFTR